MASRSFCTSDPSSQLFCSAVLPSCDLAYIKMPDSQLSEQEIVYIRRWLYDEGESLKPCTIAQRLGCNKSTIPFCRMYPYTIFSHQATIKRSKKGGMTILDPYGVHIDLIRSTLKLPRTIDPAPRPAASLWARIRRPIEGDQV